jgi:hypothetical protein
VVVSVAVVTVDDVVVEDADEHAAVTAIKVPVMAKLENNTTIFLMFFFIITTSLDSLHFCFFSFSLS